MTEAGTLLGALPEWLAVVVVIFIVVLALLWMLLPFLIVGTNKRLDKIIKLLRGQPDK